MTCHTFQEQFVEYLLDELSASEVQAIEEHLHSGCVECNRDFQAIREGANILFAAVPRSSFSDSKRDEIFARAIQATSQSAPNFVATLEEPYSKSAVRHESDPPLGSTRSARPRLWQGMLALAAGFALVLCVPLANRDKQTSNQLGSSTGNSVPTPTVEPKLVSFHYVTHEKQTDEQELTGFLLVDAQAGEIHLLGAVNMSQLLNAPPTTLVIVTASGVTNHPLTFSASGQCRSLVPLPKEPILKMEIHQSEDGRWKGSSEPLQ